MRETEWAFKVLTGEVEAVQCKFNVVKIFAADAAVAMIEKNRINLNNM